jgi:hypothetical protein
MFAATVANDYSGHSCIVLHALLAGTLEQNRKPISRCGRLTHGFTFALHYDVLSEQKESKECMKMALKMCPSFGNGDDIVHTLPMLTWLTRLV